MEYKAAEASAIASGRFRQWLNTGFPARKSRSLQQVWPYGSPKDWPRNTGSTLELDFGWIVEQSAMESARIRSSRGTMFLATSTSISAGWPCRCWWSVEYWPAELFPAHSENALPPPGVKRFSLPIHGWWRSKLGVDSVPYGIHPWSFAANTLLYATIPCAAWLTLGAYRRWRRGRAGRCHGCGYDLTGLPAATDGAATVTCPECGRVCRMRG